MIETLQIREVGEVKEIKKNIAKVVGLSNCMNGQLLDITTNAKGMIMGFTPVIARPAKQAEAISKSGIASGASRPRNDGSSVPRNDEGLGQDECEALVLLLGKIEEVKVGDNVYSKMESFKIPVGEGFLGRVVNALAEPVDGKGPVRPKTKDQRLKTEESREYGVGSRENVEYYPVFREAPSVLERIPVKEAFETGILIIDTTIPIGKGQRELVIGDRMIGKSAICIDAILNQKEKGIICIYCCIGRSYPSLEKIVETFKVKAALDYTIVVAATASSSGGEQYLAPYTACALGEYFMDKGRDVFVVFDDLTKHAWVYRQLSLLLERSPGRDAYPGDVFYLHSQLMERAGKLRDPEPFLSLRGAEGDEAISKDREIASGASRPRNDTGKGGSMTFFPIVDTLQGDITGYIPSNLVSMTDGQVYFNTALFSEGFKPAIDLGLSVSRIGNKVQCPAMKELSAGLRLEYVQYNELLRMTRFKTGVSEEITERLKHGEAMTQLFIQNKNEPYTLEKQLILLYALRRKVLDELSKEEIEHFKRDILEFAQREFPEVIKDLSEKKTLTPEIKKGLDECLLRFFKE